MSPEYDLVGLAATLYLTLAFAGASVMDLRHREIEPLYWIALFPAAPALAVAGLAERDFSLATSILLTLVSLLPGIIAMVLYRLCMLGGADAAALLLLGLAGLGLDSWMILPPSLTAVAYAAPAAIVIAIARAAEARCLFSCRVTPEEAVRSHSRMWLIPSVGSGGCGVGSDISSLAGSGGEARLDIPLVAALGLGVLASIILGDEPLLGLLGPIVDG